MEVLKALTTTKTVRGIGLCCMKKKREPYGSDVDNAKKRRMKNEFHCLLARRNSFQCGSDESHVYVACRTVLRQDQGGENGTAWSALF